MEVDRRTVKNQVFKGHTTDGKKIVKIGAEHTMKDGKERSLEDIVKIFIEEHKAKQK